MAKILDFVRRTPARVPAGTAVPALLEDFSIEVMPRTAAKIDDFRAILPAGTRVYLAHIDGTDFAEMLATARRLVDEGFAVMPHFPARGIASPRRARRPHRRLRRRRRPPGAGDRRRHRPAARRVPRGAPAAARPASSTRAGFTELHVAGHPEGNRDIDPAGGDAAVHGRARSPRTPSSTRPTRRWRSPPSSPSRPGRSSLWADRLRAAGITLPVHIGVAGPAKLQTMLKFAMACGVGPSLARAAAPRRRPRQADAAVRADRVPGRARRATRRRTRTSRSSACTSSRSAASPRPPTRPPPPPRPAAPRPGMSRIGAALRPRRHPRRHRPPAPRRLRRRSWPSAAATLTLDEYRTHIMGHPNEAILDRYFPGEDMADPRPQGGDVPRRASPRSVEPVAGIHAPARLGRGRRRRLRRRHQRAARQRRRHARGREPRPPAADAWSSATNARARSPTPSPTGPRCAPLGVTPSRVDRLRGLALRPPRRPRLPAPSSSA